MAAADRVRNMREARASAVWRALSQQMAGLPPFERYLAQVPEVPQFPRRLVERLPYLVLVDPRFGLRDACKLVGAYFVGDDASFDRLPQAPHERHAPFWTRMGFGAWQQPRFTEVKLGAQEQHATASEGAFFLLEHPEFVQQELCYREQLLITGGSLWPGRPNRPSYFKFHRYPPPTGRDPLAGAVAKGELALNSSDGNTPSIDVPKLIRAAP